MHYGSGQGHLGHGLPPEAFVVPSWWSSLARSLTRPHDAQLVCSLLSTPEWPHVGVLISGSVLPGSLVPGGVLLISSLLPVLGAAGLHGARLVVLSGSLLSGTIRLLVSLMFLS